MTNQKFTVVGIILMSGLFWLFSQNATGTAKQAYNLFLVTLLVSIIFAKWSVINPLLFTKA